jgi:hypothetical protein
VILELSPESETLLIDHAKRQGISVDALVERLVSERAVMATKGSSKVALPVWDLGVIGSMHRRGIYDDAD